MFTSITGLYVDLSRLTLLTGIQLARNLVKTSLAFKTLIFITFFTIFITFYTFIKIQIKIVFILAFLITFFIHEIIKFFTFFANLERNTNFTIFHTLRTHTIIIKLTNLTFIYTNIFSELENFALNTAFAIVCIYITSYTGGLTNNALNITISQCLKKSI